METTYVFLAYNSEASYAFGTEAEAAQYLQLLNKNREINLFEMAISSLTDEENETLAFNLADAIGQGDL